MFQENNIEIPKEWLFKKIHNLRREGIVYPYTEWQVKEILKCRSNIIYFYSNYVYIQSNGKIIKFNPYEFQKTMISNMWKYRYNIFKIPRQSGKTITTAAFFLYLMLFYENEICGIVANKEKVALEIVDKIQDMYRYLPFWMQQGIVNWQKSEFELENGSRVVSETTSKDALRSFSIRNLFLDEMASIEENLVRDFLEAIFPTLTSFTDHRMIISSTTKGYNMFAKMWIDAKNGVSDYVPFEIHWTDVPGRDEKFKEDIIKKFDEEYWRQEYECEILASGITLINGAVLSEMQHKNPITTFYGNCLNIYKEIDITHSYVLVADPSEGIGQNYSTFVIIDISVNPYDLIAVYRNNEIAYQLFPTIINEISKQFESLLIVMESNDIGTAVLEILNWDLETDAVIYSEKTKLGVKTTKRSKSTGCKILKDFIEYNKINIVDYNLINELFFFKRKKKSYEAQEGKTDDLVMCMVLFSYFTSLPFYKEYIDENDIAVDKMFQPNKEQIMETVPIFGYINTHEIDEFDEEIDVGNIMIERLLN